MPQAPGYHALPTVDSMVPESPADESKDQPRLVSQMMFSAQQHARIKS